MRMLLLIIALVVLPAFGGKASAQQGIGVGASLDVETIPGKKIRKNIVYAAKFLCVPDVGPAPVSGLVPGVYKTAINIHNPNPEPVRFTKKALYTLSQREERIRPGTPVVETLGPNEGLEIDCVDILKLLPEVPSGVIVPGKGFVVITTKRKRQLDVVAVYTLKNIDVVP